MFIKCIQMKWWFQKWHINNKTKISVKSCQMNQFIDQACHNHNNILGSDSINDLKWMKQCMKWTNDMCQFYKNLWIYHFGENILYKRSFTYIKRRAKEYQLLLKHIAIALDLIQKIRQIYPILLIYRNM